MSLASVIDYAGPFESAYWYDVVPRSVACPGLAEAILLHAGPPYDGSPPRPVVNAAVQAMLFEGLADDDAGARAMLADGRVRLEPAQHHGVVTPLAMVVSASMLLIAVRQHGITAFAPVVEGPPPALRFGSTDTVCQQRLHATYAWIRDSLTPIVRRHPVPIAAIVRSAVAQGDECHARTGMANDALSACLTGLQPDDVRTLQANPAFVLTVLMAAAATALRQPHAGINAVGGNGIAFGIRCHGSAAWRQVAALAPRGVRFAGLEGVTPLPAIGDSAVLDFCGLGGQALAAAPVLIAEWAAWLSPAGLARRHGIIDPETGVVDPVRITASHDAPIINLAILDATAGGLIGRGFYIPPPELFFQSLPSL